MTAPTHIAFAVAAGLIGGVDSKTTLALLAGGALLPDIDHPQSAIGRIFFFLSHPLNRLFGHRTLTHSLVLWIPLCIAGYFLFTPLLVISLGAISHSVIDCLNLSGVQMMYPVTEKIFVLISQEYRFRVGSKHEFILLIALGFVAWGAGYIGSAGGIRAMLVAFLGNYEMAIERYEKEGLRICYLEGSFRHPDGMIEKNTWLIVGTNKESGSVSIYDPKSNKVIHVPAQGKFINARLKITNSQWQAVKLLEPMILQEGKAFYKPVRRWHIAKTGDIITGYVLHNGNIQLSPL